MRRTSLKLLTIALLLGGLFWSQQLIASNRDADCELLYPGTQTCLDNSCCIGIPGQCPKMCGYSDVAQTCTCQDRLPGGGN